MIRKVSDLPRGREGKVRDVLDTLEWSLLPEIRFDPQGISHKIRRQGWLSYVTLPTMHGTSP